MHFIKALQVWSHANRNLRLAIDKPSPVPSLRWNQIKKRHGGNEFTLSTACLWLNCHFQLSTHVREKLWFPKCTPQLLLTNCRKFYFLAAFSHYAISLVLATYSTLLATAMMKTVISPKCPTVKEPRKGWKETQLEYSDFWAGIFPSAAAVAKKAANSERQFSLKVFVVLLLTQLHGGGCGHCNPCSP